MSINCNNTDYKGHRTFVKETVEANPDVILKIVLTHFDLYGSGSAHAATQNTLSSRAGLCPIFDDYGIDIVLTGHDHSYGRSHFMYNDEIVQPIKADGYDIKPKGTLYMAASSSSGSKYYDLAEEFYPYLVARAQPNKPMFSVIRIRGDMFEIDTYRTDTMAIVDSYKMRPIKINDPVGNVLHTDIKAYVNGEAIPSYNISGETAVVAEDLMKYGFNVDWDGAARTLSIVSYDAGKPVSPLSVTANTGKPGDIAFPHLFTDIKTYINGEEVRSYNINGSTCIIIDDLSAYGAASWDGDAREIRFATD